MKPTGERLPIMALVILTAMLGAYLVTPSPQPLAASEILRDGPPPWTRPSVDALLTGRACIPMEILLENRELGPVHSYSRDVACKGGPQ